jgi:hypothetical protein
VSDDFDNDDTLEIDLGNELLVSPKVTTSQLQPVGPTTLAVFDAPGAFIEPEVADPAKIPLLRLLGSLVPAQAWGLGIALLVLLGGAMRLGAILERFDEAKDLHEARENERDSEHDLRTCQYDLNAAKQKCDVDLAKAELDKKSELLSEAEKCRASESPGPRGKR